MDMSVPLSLSRGCALVVALLERARSGRPSGKLVRASVLAAGEERPSARREPAPLTTESAAAEHIGTGEVHGQYRRAPRCEGRPALAGFAQTSGGLWPA